MAHSGIAPNVRAVAASNAEGGFISAGMSMRTQGASLLLDSSGAVPITGPSGDVLRRRDIPGFSLLDALYPAGLQLPKHAHAHAYLSYILDGCYSESYAGSKCLCAAGMLRYLPPGELHENSFDQSVRCLLVKIEPSALDRLGEHAEVLSAPGEVHGIAPTWLATRLYREFQAGDDVAPLAIEGVLLEILAESARAIGQNDTGHAPRWLKRVREVIEEQYLSAPSLTELAVIGGVHQVHLSREFRKRYHCTIGEYIRKRRIEHACNLLANSDTALSEIALTCGFSDQSHFSATFKTHTGLTPAKFRESSS
jgi:AraC family transcriptional regulator